MTSSSTNIKKLGLILGVSLLGVLILNLTIDRIISTYYQALVNNPKIIEAFTRGDRENIKTISDQYRLEYQRVEGGSVVYSSSEELPTVRVIAKHTTLAHGVLPIAISDSLSQLAPIQVFHNGHLYTAAFIANEVATSGYIVYAKVLL